MKKKVHLVLGSGGARGIAHIAVIEELEKKGFDIIEVVGCSMGSVIGGIYAAGQLKEYKEWLFSLTTRDVFDLLDFTFTNQGFVKGEKIFKKHREMMGDLNIEDFEIPFTAVAADMKNNEEVCYSSGDLYKALRASVAIPGFFLPVVEEDRVLVDGGVTNPLPVNLVKKERDAIVVAVDLNAKSNPALQIKEKEEEPKWYEKLVPEKFLEPDKEKEEADSLVGLMENTFRLTQDRVTSLMLEIYKPDILVQVPRKKAQTFDFDKAGQIYKIGRQAFNQAFNPNHPS